MHDKKHILSCNKDDATNEVDCYKYDTVSNTWEYDMSIGPTNRDARVVEIGYNKLWITGGIEAGPSSKTFLLQERNISPAVSLPEPMFSHCSLLVNTTHVFIGEYLFLSLVLCQDNILVSKSLQVPMLMEDMLHHVGPTLLTPGHFLGLSSHL